MVLGGVASSQVYGFALPPFAECRESEVHELRLAETALDLRLLYCALACDNKIPVRA